MKNKPIDYATVLLSGLTNNLDKPKIAQNFWFRLQKNKQYKDLQLILDTLDQEAAKADGKILVKVYSEIALSPAELDIVTKKAQNFLGKKVILRNYLKPYLKGGVMIKTADQIIDLSLKKKLEKLANILEVKRGQ